MSIDTEDWFCVYNLSSLISPEQWPRCESRVERNTLRLLDLFSARGVEATFFMLGWVAERFPDLVREVDRRGHEVASHGYSHRLITHMTPEEFRADLLRSMGILAPLTTRPVIGFRAPSFSLTKRTTWAREILREAGLRYDSSVYPLAYHPDYGIPDAPLDEYELLDGVRELPLSCAEIGKWRIPCSGGGYFRQFPYAMTRFLMRRCNQQGRPVVFYLHPWEIDPGQPRVDLPLTKHIRHYRNLDKTEQRLERLLQDFEFTSVRTLLKL